MDKIKRHKEICEQLNAVYTEKNTNYGDSFGISVKKYGMIAALTRISDKFNRLEQLILTRSDGTKDESLIDTLLDLSNYCMMTVMEIEDMQANKSFIPADDTKKPTMEELEEFFKSSVQLRGN